MKIILDKSTLVEDERATGSGRVEKAYLAVGQIYRWESALPRSGAVLRICSRPPSTSKVCAIPELFVIPVPLRSLTRHPRSMK